MKKYYDAMYKAFYSWHNVFYLNKDADYATKLRWRDELYSELCGVVDVACLDNTVGGLSLDWTALQQLRTNLWKTAEVYF